MPTVLHILPHPGGGGETYIDLLEGLEGYRHERVALSPTRSRARGAWSVLAGRRRIRRQAASADLIHLHGDMAAMIAAPSLAGRPLLITTHGLHRLRRSEGAAGRVVQRRLRAAVAASARTICLTEEERDDLAAILPASLQRRLSLVPNGVPLAAADPERRARERDALGLDEADVAALFAGRLEARKDPLGAAGAVEAARGAGAAVVLLAAGEGPLEGELRGRRSAGVRVLGHRDDLESLYAAADLFLLPSHREGMSFALLEAMAHGLVPVVADGAGNAETVADAGVVFPAGDMVALARVLEELAADAETRARLGAAARERVGAEFGLDRFLAATREQYESALEGASPQGA